MPKQSSTPYRWLIPVYYKDKIKTSAVDEEIKCAVKICLSKRIPFTFDHHIFDLPSTL